jgi:hypothetical protein
MKADQTDRSRPLSRTWPASWAPALLSAGVIGGVWFVFADSAAWRAVPLAAVLALTAVFITWQQARASARRRLQAALAAYAEREIRQHRRKAAILKR